MKWRLAAAAAALGIVLTGCAAPCGSNGPGNNQAGFNQCGGSATGRSTELDEQQNANAQAIANVGLSLGVGAQGVEVAIVAALTESGMRNLDYGDHNSNGTMTTSRGMFQMMDAWGPLADRLDPTKAATIFFTIDKGPGVRGLLHIDGWQQMQTYKAAQAVEGSQFADGSNYLAQLPLAQRVTQEILGGATRAAAAVPAAATAPTCGNVGANGSNVTIPNNQYVVEALRGQTLQVGNAGLAKGLAAGFSQPGLPYVWGGGPYSNDTAPNLGPSNGCNRGGGQLNSCGTTIGFDCSGLSGFVIMSGGFPNPGGNSSAQAAGGQSIPWDQGQAGDLITFPGHVAVFLGFIGGVPYILEASDVGIPLHVVKLTRTDHHPTMHRYWSAGVQV